MKKFLPFIAFAFTTAFTLTNGIPVIAAGCNGHFNKSDIKECAENDNECQTKKAKKNKLNKTVKS